MLGVIRLLGKLLPRIAQSSKSCMFVFVRRVRKIFETFLEVHIPVPSGKEAEVYYCIPFRIIGITQGVAESCPKKREAETNN